MSASFQSANYTYAGPQVRILPVPATRHVGGVGHFPRTEISKFHIARYQFAELKIANVFCGTFSLWYFANYTYSGLRIIHLIFSLRVTTLQTHWNWLTFPWQCAALMPMLSGTHGMPVVLVLM